MPLQRHDALTKRLLKRRYSEYKSAKTTTTTPKENDTEVEGETSKGAITAEQPPPRLAWKDSCLRCKEFELECYAYAGRICTCCQNALDGPDDNYLKHGCLRGDLLDIISNGIPDMPGLGSDEWLFPRAATYYKVRMVYPDDERQRIRDLDDFTASEDTIETRTQALASFIQQFRNIDKRWRRCYESTTISIIEACVSVQQGILEESSKSWSPLGDRKTIIATCLRALALSHDTFELEIHMPGGLENKNLQFPFENYYDDPAISITEVEEVPKAYESKERKLPALVREMHRVMQRMLLRPQFRDLPTMLCVLCLMKLVEINLPTVETFSEREYKTNWHISCLLFDEIGENYHPLVYHWDKTAYEELVGEDSILIAYFKSFHTLWISDGSRFFPTKILAAEMLIRVQDFEEVCSHLDFPERLDMFVMGDIL
ncbi:uncharacterized protein PAC_02321 [Phialocephala subalpina]|uniref:Uncharacterized protein n=1 Tax=Phialocephala subalpina TaxID=576137 RepID=A0A1L7WI47_9HELO|nr:uncharacterized protein PAC_02321 [Phialocephala subalpina]